MAKIPTKTLIAMAGAAAMKARDYARENPEKVSQALDRVEAAVSSRTHGKYDTKVRKGSKALRGALGVPPHGTTPSVVGSTPPPEHPAWDAPQPPPPAG